MNLAIDIGNTQVKFGLFEKNEMKEAFTEPAHFDEIFAAHKIQYAIVSKTGADDSFIQKLEKHRISPLVLSHKLKIPIEIQYQTPETLGSDRIAGSVAANFLFRDKAVLKIDFGTCITYDFVDAKNRYIGGAISPGVMMRFKALHNYTAKLPLVDPANYTIYPLTGSDTETSILSGVINGIKEEVSGIIKEYEMRSAHLKVVATGGDAALFVTLLKCEIFARPYLVLEGMNHILNYNL